MTRRDISAYLMPKDWAETLEAIGLTNADLLRRSVCSRRILSIFDFVFHGYAVPIVEGSRSTLTHDSNIIERTGTKPSFTW